MAHTAGRSTQQAWDEQIGRIMSLSSATVARNSELEAQVIYLQQELAALKHAQAKLGLLGESTNDTKFIHCVIDGDSHIFNQTFFRMGERGGAEVGQLLAQGIANYLTKLRHLQLTRGISFWITIFLNKKGLYDTLVGRNICTAENFEDFFYGFSQSSPRFSVVDIGQGLQGPEVKIKEWLVTYLGLPQTMAVFMAGSDIGDYHSTLCKLDAQRLLDPLVLLEGVGGIPSTLLGLQLPSLRIDSLFMQRDRQPLTPSSSPKTSPIGSERRSSSSGMASPPSPSVSTLSSSFSSMSDSHPRLIDLTRPLHRQDPPPCNEFYLMSCFKGADCKYSHDYILTPDQLQILAESAKKAPCHYLKKGLPCENGSNCCWGHVCPHGSNCFHFSKKKCWFKGEAMHDHAPMMDVQNNHRDGDDT